MLNDVTLVGHLTHNLEVNTDLEGNEYILVALLVPDGHMPTAPAKPYPRLEPIVPVLVMGPDAVHLARYEGREATVVVKGKFHRHKFEEDGPEALVILASLFQFTVSQHIRREVAPTVFPTAALYPTAIAVPPAHRTRPLYDPQEEVTGYYREQWPEGARTGVYHRLGMSILAMKPDSEETPNG